MTKLTWLGLRYEARAWLVMLVRRWMAEFTCYYPFFVSSVCATQHRGLTLVTVARATSRFAPTEWKLGCTIVLRCTCILSDRVRDVIETGIRHTGSRGEYGE